MAVAEDGDGDWDRDRRSAPVAVLGMHRSGTSYVAGSLERAGLRLGAVSIWNPHNQRGNREHPRAVDINEAVLADSGGSWDRPPATITWTARQRRRARRFAAEHAGPTRWGFKDPRTLLTLAGWRRILPDLTFVGVFRHPRAVADSLQARARYGGLSMSDDDCFSLWQEYNLLLLRVAEDEACPLVDFDDEVVDLERAVDVVARGLGLAPAGEGRFLDSGLRHQSPRDVTVPGPVRETLDRLRSLAVRT